MNKFKLGLISLAAVIGMAFVPVALADTASASAKSEVTKGFNAAGGSDKANTKSVGAIAKIIVNAILYVLGAVSVIMIVFGGIRYTTSAGNSAQVKGAKDTIMYAVIGLLIAIFAYAIVNFVLTSFV